MARARMGMRGVQAFLATLHRPQAIHKVGRGCWVHGAAPHAWPKSAASQRASCCSSSWWSAQRAGSGQGRPYASDRVARLARSTATSASSASSRAAPLRLCLRRRALPQLHFHWCF